MYLPDKKTVTNTCRLLAATNQHHIDFYQHDVSKVDYIIENKTFTKKHRVFDEKLVLPLQKQLLPKYY